MIFIMYTLRYLTALSFIAVDTAAFSTISCITIAISSIVTDSILRHSTKWRKETAIGSYSDRLIARDAYMLIILILMSLML